MDPIPHPCQNTGGMSRPERREQRPTCRTVLSAYEQAWQRSQREPTPPDVAVLLAGEEP